jgi:hypothetical protein
MRVMPRLALSLALAITIAAGCGGSNPPAPPSPAPAPAPAPTDELDVTKLGSPCDEHGACAAPMECVRYYGYAGPRGPEFSSCEIRCSDAGATCPGGARCVTIADGPGAVCRP